MIDHLKMVDEEFRSAQKRLAHNLRTVRQISGISQEALAHEAGIDRTYVSQLERALVNPSLHVLVRISRELGVDVQQLLGEDELKEM